MKSKFENDNNLIKVNGNIKFKLLEVLNKNNISRHKLSRITGIRYETICNYCTGDITLINRIYLTIFCEVLDCNVTDIIEYVND